MKKNKNNDKPLSDTQKSVLSLIKKNTEITYDELADLTGFTKQYMFTCVNQLAALGYLKSPNKTPAKFELTGKN